MLEKRDCGNEYTESINGSDSRINIRTSLAAARRIPEGDTLCRTTGFNGWAPLFFLGREVHGKTIGIIGLGEIGRQSQSVRKRLE